MQEPISIKYRWTAEELILAQKYHSQHICRPIYQAGMKFIYAMVILSGVAFIESGSWPFFGTALIAVGTYSLFFRGLERRRLTRRRFRNRPDRDMEIQWQVNEEKISIQSTLGKTDCTWNAFTKVVSTPNGVLLYGIDSIFHWLPSSGFIHLEAFQNFIDLAKKNIPRNFELK